MRNISNEFLLELKKQAREVGAYLTRSRTNDRGIVITSMFNGGNWLKSVKREAIQPESKYFGFYTYQKITVELVEYYGAAADIVEGDELILYYDKKDNWAGFQFPKFIVKETNYNDTTKVLTVVAYDKLYSHLDEPIGQVPANILELFKLCSKKILGTMVYNVNGLQFPEVEPNVIDTDTVGNCLTWICELMGCSVELVVNMVGSDTLKLKYPQGTAYSISKSDYYELKVGDKKKLSSILVQNSLGNKIEYGDDTGYQQIINDNPLFEKLSEEEVEDRLAAIKAWYQYDIAPLNLSWRGNPALELGDLIEIECKNGTTITVPYIYGTFDYNGGFKETINWNRVDGTYNTIDRVLNKVNQTTKAEIDKVNQTITLITNKTDDLESSNAELQVSLEGITSTVSSVQQNINNTNEAIDATNNAMATLQQQVLQQITPENVQILINQTLSNGIDSVQTSTGFKFDKDGLNITKTGSQMSSLLDEDGLRVSKGNETVLVANSQGVEAINLTAKQYLIIGTTSRFQDYLDANSKKRTGCFWIG